jgi:hypothetical protein
LKLLNLNNTKSYAVRVIRRHNLRDFKDYQNGDFDVHLVSDFVIRSTFVGPEQNFIKELNLENANKIFVYNKPVLILFRDLTKPD